MKIKRLIFSALISSAIIFSGCSNKAANSAASNNTKNGTTSSTAASANQTENNSSASAASTAATGNLKPIKPNTVHQLSTEQKKKIDSKMDSALKSLDNTLKSIQDPSDINLDSTN